MEIENQVKKPVILSGIQPTGKLHIGNLIGAIQNWVRLQDEYECYFTIVDLHAITVKQVPAELRKNTIELAALLLATGIDPEKSTLFIQSHVSEHSQLAWVLNCFAQMGELHRMTQFKDKSKKNKDNINVGLFDYPVLQAADILLYQADLVPVGEDQRQHLELSRNIAERFNFNYSETFKVPDAYIPPIGAKIMNLQDPTKKMSKSDDNEKATIYILDSDNEIKNKIKRAITDSDEGIKFTDKKPGIKNLITLYNIATGKSFADIEKEFDGVGYGDFKASVGDAVALYIKPIRERFEEIKKDEKFLKEVLSAGAEKARRTAMKTLRKVYKKVGFVSF
jgi:tryptophanyl-tRNA synthetase